MDEIDRGPQETRAVFLSAMLGLLVASGILFFLFLICGGFSIYVLAVVGGLVAFGLVHYFLWGHAFSEQVAEEREEEALRDDADPDEWPTDDLPGPHRRF